MAGLFKHISIRKNKVSDLLGFSMEKITFLDHGIDFLEALKKHGAHFSRAGDHLQIGRHGVPAHGFPFRILFRELAHLSAVGPVLDAAGGAD